jgi:hypothetical protein
MLIPIEDLRRLIFEENKSYGEIAKMYGITTGRLRQMINYLNIPVDRVKTCKNNTGKNPPSEGSGGMKFELTKD